MGNYISAHRTIENRRDQMLSITLRAPNRPMLIADFIVIAA